MVNVYLLVRHLHPGDEIVLKDGPGYQNVEVPAVPLNDELGD